MQLEQLKPFDPKPAQAPLDLIPQELRPSADRRIVRRFRRHDPYLRRDEQVVWIRV